MLSTVINDVAALSPVSSGHSTFKQLIDHDNATLGTFDQHYWYNYSLWGGPGYPVSPRPGRGRAVYLLAG